MRDEIAALALWALTATAAAAQGFAGLGTGADGFAVPERGHTLAFPADHGPHPAYRIEWWYLTANLTGPEGTRYGVQWTLFRTALAPETGGGWQSPQLWMGHAAVTTPERQFSAERLARGDIGEAGARAVPFSAWIDSWQMQGTAPEGDPLSALALTARGKAFAYALDLAADGPLVLHGDRGYSVKSAEGQASYYYSQPFYRAEGTLTLPSGEVAVTGRAWLDREWSSQPLAEDQEGWDWISLHLESGAKLMGFRLREEGGGAFTSATWIAPDGSAEPLDDGALTLTPEATAKVAGRDIPVRWRVALPGKGLDVTITALNDAAWMPMTYAYWEGPVTVSGSSAGVGYLEMTGYERD